MKDTSPFRTDEGRMILLFDLLWILGAVPAYGVPSMAAASVLWWGWHLGGWFGAAFVAPLAYVAFLVGLVAAVGLLSNALPRPRPGTSRVFVDRDFFAFLMQWGVENYVPRPFITHIQLLTGLRTAYYRLLGADLLWSTHLSPGAQIWNPSMVTLGHLTYVGEHAQITGHLSLGDKLLVAPVIVGDRSNLGAHVHVAPGCTFGKNVRVGALSDIAPSCEVADDVEIGPRCVLGMGVKIGAGARIEPRTFLASFTTVPPGEIWAGDPGSKVGVVRDTPGERRKRRRRAHS